MQTSSISLDVTSCSKPAPNYSILASFINFEKAVSQCQSSGNSLHGWQFLWCVFSFTVRKVKVSAARMLNQGRNRKRWGRRRGEMAVVFLTTFTLRSLPHRFFFRPHFSFRAAESLTLRITKEKSHQENCPLSRLEWK